MVTFLKLFQPILVQTCIVFVTATTKPLAALQRCHWFTGNWQD